MVEQFFKMYTVLFSPEAGAGAGTRERKEQKALTKIGQHRNFSKILEIRATFKKGQGRD
jgi:hypothetical protein